MKNIILIWTLLVTISISAQKKEWTLIECIKHAIENNISIKENELDLEQSKINKKDAIGNFLPSLNTSNSHSWNIGLNQNITTGLLENQTTQFTALSLSSNISIYNGLRNFNQLHRSNLAILASRYQLENIKDDTSLLVINSFLQVLFNKEQLKVFNAQLDLSKQELKRTIELVKVGLLPKGEILELNANIASQEQKVVDSKNTIFLSKVSLAQILLIDDYQNFDIINSEDRLHETTILNKSPDEIIQKAKETRYNLKIAETNVKLAEYDLKLAKGALHPTLKGFYSYNTRASYSDRVVGVNTILDGTNSAIGFLESTGEIVLAPNSISSPITRKPDAIFNQFSFNDGHSFGLSLEVPIFNGFSARNSVKRNRINLERTKYQLKKISLELEAKVYQAINDTKGALKSYETALQVVETRKEAFNYSKKRYTTGLINAFDFSQNQNKYEEAQNNYVRAKYDYIFKLKILEFYFGISLI